MAEEKDELANVDIGDVGVEVDMSSKNLQDGYVYFIDPEKQVCPKCGAIGSIMRGACQACACMVVLNRDLAGKKMTKQEFMASGGLTKMGKKVVKAQKPQTKKKTNALPEDGELPQEDAEDDFEIKEEKLSEKDMAIATLKKAKEMLKEHEDLIAKYFAEVKITFAPFKMEVTPRAQSVTL